MNNLSTITEKTKLYKMLLLYDNIAISLLDSLFDSFELMFKKHSSVRQHGIPNTYYHLVPDENKTFSFNTFKFHLYTNDSDTYKIEILIDDVVLAPASSEVLYKNKLSHEDDFSDEIDEFINRACTDILNAYCSLCKTKINQIPLDAKDSLSEIGFIKKINSIREDGQMFKYLLHFDDGTHYNVLTPHDLSASVEIGDFAHLDEHNNFNFISKHSIQ